MEPDQHSGSEQGTGDRAPDPGAKPAPSEPDPGLSSDLSADAIMSKLPRTRPQRVTGRRQREQARQAPRGGRETPAASQEASPISRGAKGTSAQSGTAARPKSRAATSARAAKQPKRAATGARNAAPSARPARRRPPAALPVDQAASPRDPARRQSQTSKAPGLPRLAVDGALEAAKLPLRVGGRLTLRALDAAARGLRGR